MTDTQLTVSRVVDAPADAIFDLLTLPQRHREFDGSGTIVSDDRTQRIQAVGDTFTMNMNAEAQGGDYQMKNEVIAYVPNKVVGWAPENVASGASGWTWVYTLEPQGPEATQVTLTYDWSSVEDKKLASIFPAFDKDTLEDSLNQLAAAVA